MPNQRPAWWNHVLPLALLGTLLSCPPVRAQGPWPGRDRLEAERCDPDRGGGAEWLDHARQATGLTGLSGGLRFEATESNAELFDSDRMYPPFLGSSVAYEFTFDPTTGTEWARALGGAGRDVVRTRQALFIRKDSAYVPAAELYRLFEPSRALNPLAVLLDWTGGPVTVVARCTFRDYPRVVLSRGRRGERLYLDAKTAVPVKYERVEPHPLWGQVRAEYVYTTWWQAGPAILPSTAVRFLDGVEQLRRDLLPPQTAAESLGESVPASATLPALLPSPLPDHRGAPDPFTDLPVDTVRVGDHTWLLRTTVYTHAVTQVGDTVVLFDATTGESRSRADSAWISRLFPGRNPMVLVVTDLAWPHVSGVRFWVARGAAIATHRLSRPFLEQVIAHRWTLEPDALERNRAATRRLRWIVVDSTRALAGGAVRLQAIDGVSTEGALMGMVPRAGFLWAGDYVQSVARPSLYAREVMAAVRRAGFVPDRFAAEHLTLTPWRRVLASNRTP